MKHNTPRGARTQRLTRADVVPDENTGTWNPSIQMTQPVKLPLPHLNSKRGRIDGVTEEFLFENIPAMIWIKDHEGTYLRVNRWAAKGMGMPENELVGCSDHSLGREDADEYRKIEEEVLETGIPKYGSLERLYTAEGQDIILLTDKIPIIDRVGRAKGVAVISRDITRQRQSEVELVESRNRLGLALWGANMGCWDWNVPLRDLSIDERAAAIVDLSDASAQIKGGDFGKFVHPDDLVRVKKAYADHVAGEEPVFGAECRVRWRVDQPYRWLQLKGRVVEFDEAGNAMRLSGTVLDVTERRRIEEEKHTLERQMQHAQKLESLGVLAGGIAHDFNNLLTGILSQTGIARVDLAAGHSNLDAHLQLIETAAKRMGELTKQMLAYSGRGTYQTTCFDVNTVITEIADLLKASVDKKAKFALELSEEAPVTRGDASQMHQVLLNLITNASDALKDGEGTITLRTGFEELNEAALSEMPWSDELKPGRYVRVEVEDNGCGMDEETRSRLFEPFFTTKFAGRGLGLAAVLGIVRSHRGLINVKSAVNAGTVFTIYTPADANEVVDEEEDTSVIRASVKERKGRILVIDDEKVVRMVCAQALSVLGFEVVGAADGPEAIKILERDHAKGKPPYAGVLLDMTMPSMNGVEVYRLIRQLDGKVPVCIMSGYSEEEISEMFADASISGFLPKPFQLSDIELAVDRMMLHECGVG
ncbi:MAG: ATP-binding protein [Verrucomicrobiota bacterium]